MSSTVTTKTIVYGVTDDTFCDGINNWIFISNYSSAGSTDMGRREMNKITEPCDKRMCIFLVLYGIIAGGILLYAGLR